MATLGTAGEPNLTYEDVDTSLMPPRPRLYGLVGAETIEEVWKKRQAAKAAGPGGANGNGSNGAGGSPTATGAAAAS